jgi:hypothetical protein
VYSNSNCENQHVLFLPLFLPCTNILTILLLPTRHRHDLVL